MLNRYFVVFMLLALVLISACSYVPSWPGRKDPPSVGDRHLSMSFNEGLLRRSSITISDQFSIPYSITIRNRGAPLGDNVKLKIYDNIPGQLTEIEGNIHIPGGEDIYDEQGKNIVGVEVEEVVVTELNGKSLALTYQPDRLADDSRLILSAELYIPQYRVTFQPKQGFCVSGEEEDASCPAIETISGGALGKGATYPVSVQSIEKIVTPRGEDVYFMELKITFRNTGGGVLVKEDGTSKDAMGIPSLSLISSGPGGQSFVCSPESTLTFYNNVATMSCYLNELRAEVGTVSYFPLISYEFPYKMRIQYGPVALEKERGYGGGREDFGDAPVTA